MMNYIQVYTLLLTFVFCTTGKGQSKTHLSKENAKEVNTSNGPNNIVRSIIQDRKGNIWMASWEGVFRYDGKSFTNVTSGVSSARFFSLLEDRKGNLWFSSIGSGVYRYDGYSFQNFTTDDGLLNNEIVCIYEDKLGHIWFGAWGGASRYDGKSFRNFIIDGASMAEDRTGKTFPNSQRPPYEVNSIMEDKTGKLWLGTRGKTFVYDGKKFTVVTREPGKSFTNIRCIIEDRKGNIWLGGNGGLWRFDGTIFTNVTKSFGGYIYQDRNGNIWTSSEGANGNWVLSRYEAKSLYHETPIVTKIEPRVGMLFGILEDDKGYIWFGAASGVYRYDGNAIKDFKAFPYQAK